MTEPEGIGRVVSIDDISTRRFTFAEYQAIDAVNWSTLKGLLTSPLHYQHLLSAGRGDTDALRLGRVVHIATFEPDRFGLDVAVWEGGRRQGKDWDLFKELHWREIIVNEDEYTRVVAIRDAVRACPLVKPYLAMGEAERVVLWKDRKTSVAMKARLDWLGANIILDLKTARNAIDPHAFARDAWRLGYYHQAACYQRGVATTRGTGQGPPVLLVAVESVPPHDVAVYRPTEDALHFAGEQVDELLARLVQCRAEGKWPGRFNAEQELEVPRWAMPDVEDYDVEDPPWMKD